MAAKKFKLIIAALIMASFIISFFIFLFIKNPSPSTYTIIKYNGDYWEKKDGIWFTELEVQGKKERYSFLFNPKEVEDVPILGTPNTGVLKKPVYMTTDPKTIKDEYPMFAPYEVITIYALQGTAFRGFGLSVGGKNITVVCPGDLKGDFSKEQIYDGKCVAHVPIINCEPNGENLIYLNRTGKASIIFNGNCTIINGYDKESYRAVEKFLLIQLGVMTN